MSKEKKLIFNELKMKAASVIPVESIIDSRGVVLRLQPVAAVSKPLPGTGVTETLEAVTFIAAVANVVYSFILKGWTGLGWFTIIWRIIPLVKSAIPAIKGMGNIPAELNDLTAPEKDQVLEAIKEHLLFSEDVESIVNIALDIIYKIKLIAGTFK